MAEFSADSAAYAESMVYLYSLVRNHDGRTADLHAQSALSALILIGDYGSFVFDIFKKCAGTS